MFERIVCNSLNRRDLFLTAALFTLTLVSAVRAQPAATPAPRSLADWVKKSNQNTKVMVELWRNCNLRRLRSSASRASTTRSATCHLASLSVSSRRLARSMLIWFGDLPAETEPRVKQDLEILIKAAADEIKGAELNERLKVPYFSLDELMFASFRGLLDDQIAPNRRPAALVRLRKYTGLEAGTKPITEYAIALVRERMNNPGLVAASQVKGRERPRAGRLLRHRRWQIVRCSSRSRVTSRPMKSSRNNSRCGTALSNPKFFPGHARTSACRQNCMHSRSSGSASTSLRPSSPPELTWPSPRSRAKCRPSQCRLRGIRGFHSSDYREVIKALKKEQLVGEGILAHYQARLKQIEEIIEGKQILTLPARAARIRMATEAESAATPAPNMHPPRLLGNTGEVGEFVLPLNVPDNSGKMQTFDDFSFAAASWTLTAHEARPGHELQFASIVEQGVSDARILFAFNSTNVEGWGLYAEWLIEPFEPADGHLICLQHRLMRAARAFLRHRAANRQDHPRAGPGDIEERRRPF